MLLIISGPSGVGKTTITRQVEQQLGGTFSVSMTTRPKSPSDTEGVDYYFVNEADFLRARDQGELLEWAKVFDNYYGTPRRPVEQALRQGKLMILEIDVQGAVQVKSNMPGAFAIFVLPPSEQVLLERLRNRQREDESVIQRRFAKAKHEIEQAKTCGIYDHFIVNDNLEQALTTAVSLVQQAREQAR